MRLERPNNRASWSESDLATLRQLIGLQLPMHVIARNLERSEEAVRVKAHRVALADMRSGLMHNDRSSSVRGH
jgi:hypothetical protein